MTYKKHINDAQPSTVDEHFQLILDDREIIDSEFVEVTPDDLPDWFDEKLFKTGQEFYVRNLLGFAAGHITGLTAIIAVPDILEVLLFTKRNATFKLSYKRFAETLLLMYALLRSDIFAPNSKWFNALNVIRRRHANVNKRRVSRGLHGIYQKDMAITQFGFLGYIFVCPEKLGLARSTYEEMKGYNHLWQVIGHLLDIDDRINICRRTVEETTELCRRIQTEIIAKHLKNPRPEFLRMTTNIVHGLWYIDFSINEDSFLVLTYDLTGIKYTKPLSWYSYLNLKYRQTTMCLLNVPLIGWLLRSAFNLFLGLTYWILEYYPIVPILAFGKKDGQIVLYEKS
ncbi:uncharacterized protein LOC122529255 [Frieseomelitta varia]|uniref:uncharacterized protein LOC122529255 n=1 Tax=Frieseomelitta varia TaxID=561572 RepID=UPI001CB6A848|nr:uncharacterized protein LOC122529255 [Frieseomelitta varia]XP_043511128.1 uncharacterized protein LOC122529255 [Frieseomelitta varia]XP_043511129.1 uncharacterized protein LOC122529255 [Frieseomelitta varia]